MPQIKAASDGAEAAQLGEYGDDGREDWDLAKQDVLLQVCPKFEGGRDRTCSTQGPNVNRCEAS